LASAAAAAHSVAVTASPIAATPAVLLRPDVRVRYIKAPAAGTKTDPVFAMWAGEDGRFVRLSHRGPWLPLLGPGDRDGGDGVLHGPLPLSCGTNVGAGFDMPRCLTMRRGS
jgi:hypothetical protein